MEEEREKEINRKLNCLCLNQVSLKKKEAEVTETIYDNGTIYSGLSEELIRHHKRQADRCQLFISEIISTLIQGQVPARQGYNGLNTIIIYKELQAHPPKQ